MKHRHATEPHAPPKEEPNFAPQFCLMMAVYLLLVFGWTVRIGPLGRDFALLAHPLRAPGLGAPVLWAETALFGGWAPAYHVANLVLMYACMLSLFFFTRLAVRGPWWLGSLVAVMTMANPVKAEAMLHLSGAVDLVPALAAFAMLCAYAWHVRSGGRFRYAAALALFALAAWGHPGNAALVLVLALYEWLLAPRERKNWKRLLPFAVVALVLAWPHLRFVLAEGLALRMAPLVFIPYPIGLLPETCALYASWPVLAWATAACVAAFACFVAWKARHPAIAFGLPGMVLVRFFAVDTPVDPVHLVGGGALLVPLALFNLAFAALCTRVQRHPKWKWPVVLLTTILCAALFVAQGAVNLAWGESALVVRRFQEQAQAAVEARPGESLGVLPDYRYWRGAPLCLSDSINADGPFSRALPHMPLLPVNAHPEETTVEVLAREAQTGGVSVTGGAPLALLSPPYRMPEVGEERRYGAARVTFTAVREDGFDVRITTAYGELPDTLLPVSAPE